MIWATVRGGPVLLFDGIFKYRTHWWRKTENRGFQNWVLAEDAFWSLKKKCGLGNVFSHTKMRPLLFCVSDTPKTALIYLKNGPNCCVRFYFGGRFIFYLILWWDLYLLFAFSRFCIHYSLSSPLFSCQLITFANNLDPVQYQQSVGSDLDTDYLTLW